MVAPQRAIGHSALAPGYLHPDASNAVRGTAYLAIARAVVVEGPTQENGILQHHGPQLASG